MTASPPPPPTAPPANRVTDAARWFYRGVWRVLIDWFRVPVEAPTLPVETDEVLEAFQPAPGLLDYFRFWFWVLTLLAALLIAIGWIVVAAVLPWLGMLLLPVVIAVVVAPTLIAYVGLHLRYDTTWYVMTTRSLRIRRGIWHIHEMTITFENVQNVKAEQGPLQRYFGIGSLVIETAGGGGGKPSQQGFQIGNRAVIEGVADTRRLRDHILTYLQSSRASGLGDETSASGAAWTKEHVAALREVREAVRRLAPGAGA